MAFVTTTKDAKSFRKELAKTGVFYSDVKLAEELKAYLPTDITEIYDPTCGNGNLLSVFSDDVKKYGQELDELQVVEANERLVNSDIVAGNTLTSPAFMDRKFKAIIANPPFSIAWEQMPDDVRFSVAPALAPKSKADYAFVLHCLHMLADDGVCACQSFPGIAYRGNAEGKIRQWLIEQNYIDRVVSFPGGYFADTNIATICLVFKKNKTTTDIVFEDKALNKERTVTLEEVIENNYCLSVNLYIYEEVKKEKVDIFAVNNRVIEELKFQIKHILKIHRVIQEIDPDNCEDIETIKNELIEVIKNEE